MNKMKKVFFIVISIVLAFLGATPAHAQGFAGRYHIVQGVYPDGSAYSGHAVVEPLYSGWYRLHFKVQGIPESFGVGFVEGDTLGIGWSDSPNFGVVIYKVDGGRLSGRWLVDSTQEAYGVEELEGPPGLNGVYNIVKAYGDDNGEEYYGTVEIRPQGAIYNVTWTIGAYIYTGIGLLKGDLFIVGSGARAGVLYYEKKGDGLTGVWAGLNSQDLGTETLVRLKKKPKNR